MQSENYQTISIESIGDLIILTLNRPEVKNAFNDIMIAEVSDFFGRLSEKNHRYRVVIITGSGNSFCAGADLNWMKKMVDYTFEENLADSLKLAAMFRRISECHLPVIARVNGPAIGGGAGLVAVCDMAVAAESAVFGLSEVKLGLAPAVISPYMIRKIGDRHCREYFLTGERFSAARGAEIGLLNRVVPDKDLDQAINEMVERLRTSGPNAIAACKKLLTAGYRAGSPETDRFMAELIARLRISDEAQEGMRAFLEKRKPSWHERP